MPPKNAPQGRPPGKAVEKSNAEKKPSGLSSGNHGQYAQPSKRKSPNHPGGSSNTKPGNGTQPDTRASKRMKTFDTRTIAAQKSHAALKDGELDVQAFVNSMAFEINALDESMRRTRTSKTSRAFQRVPFRMRRRAAAHNYRRVPKRLHKRAKREMAEDNTPTVSSKTRKPNTTRARLRAQTARRLEILARRKRLLKLKKGLGDDKDTISIRAARPKIRRNALNNAPLPAPKYRKRQQEKIWLPTHLWHAKRARMTSPTQPLWGWAIPITPTQKVYRPTHRAQWERGAMAWDMSYTSTIGMSGSPSSMKNVLKLMGLTQEALWNDKAKRWRAGAVHWSGHLSRKTQDTIRLIGPATIIWNPEGQHDDTNSTKPFRQLFIRIHPSAFLETFNELLRLVKMQDPRPYLQDLRYEIGSIDITGPDSTEALLGVLKAYSSKDVVKESDAIKFESLVGLKDPSSLPPGSLLAFSISDPRLRYPPRQVDISDLGNQSSQIALLDTLSAFRRDEGLKPHQLFDRDARFKASRLPSQQSLNRRRGKGAPGSVLEPTMVDPPIPIMLLASRSSTTNPQASGTWTLMLPWKCVLPVWYSLMHYPVSTGGNPWFGGLDEIRQLRFEHGQPWFPGDMPGTDAGNKWELEERIVRKRTWDRMPKGKRVNWGTLDLGAGRKGEIGIGWSCDYGILFGLRPTKDSTQQSADSKETEEAPTAPGPQDSQKLLINPLADIIYLPKAIFNSYQIKDEALPLVSIVTVNIKILGRGVPTPCARIYRLPEAKAVRVSTQAEVPATDPPHPKIQGQLPPNLRDQWLAQQQSKTTTRQNNGWKAQDLETRKQFLAQQLTGPVGSHPPESPTSENINGHPLCPNEEDLIGFVTSGSFSLRDGRGEGIGSLSATKAMKELKLYEKSKDPAARLCVVRNAGQNIGWLAKWDLI